MTIKEQEIIYRAKEKREESFPIDDESGLLFPENIMGETLTLHDVIPVLYLLRTDWITRIEPLKTEGLRFHIKTKQSQVQECTVQILRKMLERTVNAPVNIYWSAEHIDFIPI